MRTTHCAPPIRPRDARDDELVARYFRDRLGREVRVALDTWAAAHGWGRVIDLVRALRDEWWFGRTVEVVNRARSLGP